MKIIFVDTFGISRAVEGKVGQSAMECATANDVPGIIASCGGGMACGTCHGMIPEEWLRKLPHPSEQELGMLEGVIDPTPQSRLTCQIRLNNDLEGLTIFVPHSQG
jgi:2Fe-2S ferredoxin